MNMRVLEIIVPIEVREPMQVVGQSGEESLLL